MTNWNQAQEAMREAAAKVCDDDDEELAYSGQYNNWNARSDALKLAAAAIRALPLTPEPVGDDPRDDALRAAEIALSASLKARKALHDCACEADEMPNYTSDAILMKMETALASIAAAKSKGGEK